MIDKLVALKKLFAVRDALGHNADVDDIFGDIDAVIRYIVETDGKESVVSVGSPAIPVVYPVPYPYIFPSPYTPSYPPCWSPHYYITWYDSKTSGTSRSVTLSGEYTAY